jgi:hypothetical protein
MCPETARDRPRRTWRSKSLALARLPCPRARSTPPIACSAMVAIGASSSRRCVHPGAPPIRLPHLGLPAGADLHDHQLPHGADRVRTRSLRICIHRRRRVLNDEPRVERQRHPHVVQRLASLMPHRWSANGHSLACLALVIAGVGTGIQIARPIAQRDPAIRPDYTGGCQCNCIRATSEAGNGEPSARLRQFLRELTTARRLFANGCELGTCAHQRRLVRTARVY